MSEFTRKVSEEVTGRDSPDEGAPGTDTDGHPKGVADPGADGQSDAPSDPDDEPVKSSEPLNPA